MAQFPFEHIKISAFGPISGADIDVSPQLNVVVGENGTGKSQLLKLLYSAAFTVNGKPGQGKNKDLQKGHLEKSIAQKLLGVFRPDELGRLVTRRTGTSNGTASLKFKGLGDPLTFGLSSRSRSAVEIISYPKQPLEDTSVFLPSRELISIYPGFVSLYDTTHLEFDETWRDTAILLGAPSLRGRREESASKVLQPLQEILQGSVMEENGRFYLKRQGNVGAGKFEAHLMAEGERKLAMLVRLVSSGALLEGGYLFWDEPEANLNPRSQKYVAQVISLLASSGTQIFVATHSMFLLRELQMLASENSVETRYIGLEKTDSGVEAQSEKELEDLRVIPALEAENEQTARYLSW